ncbi:MAG: sensor histidine kinase [Anaerolineales bacterium]|nr:sensor histidine kinase [Anaerolineales bacterium]
MNQLESWKERFLRVPLFYKILLANSAIVAIGAVVGTLITVWHVQNFPRDIHYGLIAIFAGGGFFISYCVNRWVLRIALQPLDKLQDAVDLVGRSDLTARVVSPPVSDERFDQLIDTFNEMLSQLEQDAARSRSLSRHILQAQEDERQRLARELHDEAAQALTSLLVRLRLLERAYDPAEAQQRVAELRELTAQALEEVRRVALDLRPKILDDLGLVAALEWRVDELNAADSVKASFQAEGLHGRLPRETELVFYRIGQEALSNVIRHSQANQVEVTLRQAEECVQLEIFDNGQGFDPAIVDREHRQGLGLLGMHERVGMIDGFVQIESAPGRGCRIVVEAPLPALTLELLHG